MNSTVAPGAVNSRSPKRATMTPSTITSHHGKIQPLLLPAARVVNSPPPAPGVHVASIIWEYSASSLGGSPVGPFKLEFDLLFVALSFVLDVELGAGGHVDSLSGHLNLEPLARLQGVGKPAQLRYELGRRVGPLDVPVLLFAHRSSPGSFSFMVPDLTCGVAVPQA